MRRELRSTLTRVAFAACVLALVAAIWLNRHRFTPLDAGSPAPAYQAPSLAGDTVDLADLRGGVILLNVWATWCAPCVREMPALQRLHEQLAERGLHVVAVSVDAPMGVLGVFGQPGGNVQEFVDRFGLTFEILLDPEGRVERSYQVSALPTTFLIDRDGRIRRRVLGAVEWDAAPHADMVEQLLGG